MKKGRKSEKERKKEQKGKKERARRKERKKERKKENMSLVHFEKNKAIAISCVLLLEKM